MLVIQNFRESCKIILSSFTLSGNLELCESWVVQTPGYNTSNYSREARKKKKKVTKARIEQIGEEPFKIRIRLQFQLRGIDGSRAIIDITCHVNIGYRRLPNLSAEKGARARRIARAQPPVR